MRSPFQNVIAMGLLISLTFVFGTLLQSAGPPPASGDIFNSAEQSQMAKASSVEDRIRIYAAASKRIQQMLHDSVIREEFSTVPDSLNRWTALLGKSLDDIEANLKAGKKPRVFINYEIQVRKAIADTQGFKIKAPVEQQDLFDSCLDRAEAIRKKFVEILFLH